MLTVFSVCFCFGATVSLSPFFWKTREVGILNILHHSLLKAICGSSFFFSCQLFEDRGRDTECPSLLMSKSCGILCVCAFRKGLVLILFQIYFQRTTNESLDD